MDNRLSVVLEHKSKFPGYFVHNLDAARVLGELFDLGLVTLPDLAAAAAHLVENDIDMLSRDGRLLRELFDEVARRDHRGLARRLAQPRAMKLLSPLLTGTEPLRRMSTEEFRTRLLDGTRDGPFSAMVVPKAWAASARSVLAAAIAKYGGGHSIAHSDKSAGAGW